MTDDSAGRVVQRAEDRVPGSVADIEERASCLISAGPITSESTPATLFTSARHRIVRSDASLCAGVKCPRCENITL
ncbi:MAG TPA: hypothetical protein VIV12_02265 [Streptosporangiaceae bacterium]